MTFLHGKLTAGEVLADEVLFDELVEQLESTPRAVKNHLKRQHEFLALEDLFDYVPSSLRWEKVSEARNNPDLIEEIASLAELDQEEVEEILEKANGNSYVHNVMEFPWPSPEEEEEEEESATETAPTDRGTAPPTTHPAENTLTILMVSASPEGAVRLRVDKEFRAIIDRLRGSRYRDRIRAVQIQAVNFNDLRTGLLEHEPHVLHFSGHGEEDGSLIFEPQIGGSDRVSKKKLLSLLRALKDNLRLVVFNACHSHTLAADIPPSIDLAIGMTNSITDGAAIDFAVALYEALAFGKPVQTAFDAAVAGLDEDEVPQLFPINDPERKRLRAL